MITIEAKSIANRFTITLPCKFKILHNKIF